MKIKISLLLVVSVIAGSLGHYVLYKYINSLYISAYESSSIAIYRDEVFEIAMNASKEGRMLNEKESALVISFPAKEEQMMRQFIEENKNLIFLKKYYIVLVSICLSIFAIGYRALFYKKS